MALVALAVSSTVAGGPLPAGPRGARVRWFSLLKFRSMVVDAEKKTGPVWAGRRDPRVTRWVRG